MFNRWPNLKEVLHLLLPMVLTLTLELSISLIDTLMLGHYDSYHLAAVGLASSLWLPFACFIMGITFGLTPLITKHLHGRQIKLVNMYMSQAIGVCLTLGIALTLVVMFVLPYFIRLMAIEAETQRLTIEYLRIFAPAIPLLAITVSYKNLFEAAGRPMFPLVAAVIGLLVNIFLNYLLIYGSFGFPELGANGAAIASATAVLLGVLLFWGYDTFLNPTRLFIQFKRRYLFKFGILLHVGVPSGFAFSFEIMLFSSIMWLVSSFGDLAVGAGQIAMAYTSILFTPLMAISSVAAIIVAKSLAQEGVYGVQKRVKIIVYLGLGYCVTCLIMTQLFATKIPFLFTSDVEVALMTTSVLVISSVYQVVDMLQTTFTGVLRGLRDTRTSMIAFAVSLFGLSLPLGFWLSHYSPWSDSLRIQGFHIGLGMGLSLLAMILILRFFYLINQKKRNSVTSKSHY